MVVAPLGVDEPLSVAVVPPMAVAASVLIEGGVGVVWKVSTAPKLVPAEFCAMAQK